MKRFLSNTLLIILSLFLIIAIIGVLQLQDRHPDIAFDFRGLESSGLILVGAAALPITPEFEPWNDVNENARFDPNIDTYEDQNDNGKFDAVWMAGFHARRATARIHDPLLASAMVIEVGGKKIGLLSLDVIGLGNDECWHIRKKIQATTDIDHTYIIATHNHEGHDLIGMWGASAYKSGVDENYLNHVINQSAVAMQLAWESRQAARITLARDSSSSESLFLDTRPPNVTDPDINILQARSIDSDQVIGTLINWGNHVETLWDQNLELSADFVHFLRKGIQEGVQNDTMELVPAMGGVTLFLPGSVGGLMTTTPELSIRDPRNNTVYTKPGFAKAEAQGYQLALIVHQALQQADNPVFFHTTLNSYQQVIPLPLDNWNFRLGAYLGILDRGMTGWMKVRSEIGYWELGPASFLHVPGEIYPELTIGSLEEPEGADLPNQALEIPPLKSVMTGEYRWIVGLSNDMIGYILPRSQWDVKAPYTYNLTKAPYGEIMSLGPQTAPRLHAALLSLIARKQASPEQPNN